MSPIPLGILAASGKSIGSGWILNLTLSSAGNTFNGQQYSSGSGVSDTHAFYKFLTNRNVAGQTVHIVRVAKNGTVAEVLDLNSSNGGNIAVKNGVIATDRTNNELVFTTGYPSTPNVARNYYNGFQSYMGISTTNVYAIKYGNSNGGWAHKYNSAGTILWERRIGSAENGMAADGDASDNGYFGWYSHIVKLNSAGTHQWSRSFGTGVSSPLKGLAVDSAGNSHTAWNYIQPNSQNGVTIVKLDTNGGILWQRTIGNSGSYMGAHGMCVDASGNSYVLTYNDTAKYLFKYNSAGVLQWQRSIVGNQTNYLNYGHTLSTDGNFLYFGMMTALYEYDKVTLFKIPANGSVIGTFSVVGQSSFTFAASSIPEAASTYVASSLGAQSVQDATNNNSAGSFTYQTFSSTPTLKVIP